MIWDALNARARGLGTRLLERAALAHLAAAPDLPALATALESRGLVLDDPARISAPGLERAVRRHLAGQLRTLARWSGASPAVLAVLFESEDRRSIATLIRGAVQRAPADLRLSGLIPTPELGERPLQELAAQPTPKAVAALLAAWRHPLAPALLPEAARPEPDLLKLETSLGRAWAERALAAARKDGRRGVLCTFVRQLIDLDNAGTVLLLAGEPEPRVAQHWLPGGALTLALGERAAATGGALAAGRVLAAGFGSRRLAAVLRDPPAGADGIELAALAALIAELRAIARTAPLSAAPLLAYALRLRAEALDLRRMIWGIALGTPPRTLSDGLVSTP